MANHEILHRRQRFYELTCKRNTVTCNVTFCRKHASALRSVNSLKNGEDRIFGEHNDVNFFLSHPLFRRRRELILI